VIEIAVDATKTPEAIRGVRNVIILTKILGTIEPELVEGLARALPEAIALTKAHESRPFNLWQMFKKMCSQDTRRALSAMLRILESFGKSLGS
jgi:uncharacterized protein YjgD (DUF1641 family)